jgi:hypothetical protein
MPSGRLSFRERQPDSVDDVGLARDPRMINTSADKHSPFLFWNMRLCCYEGERI